MVVTMNLGQISPTDSEDGLDHDNSLSLQLLDDTGEKVHRIPALVKNLTMTGVILDIPKPENGLRSDGLKGRESLLRLATQEEDYPIELPGRILWTRNHEDDRGLTLGLDLLEPMPLPIRQALEASMTIDAKDMKVLWDYWDEIQEAAVPADEPEPVSVVSPVPRVPKSPEASKEPRNGRGNILYWIGFSAILSGLAMQYGQSEHLGFIGLGIMFGGSIVVAWRSIISMWQMTG
jgi:hypothetical protein